jgi:hypothetical protein
MALPGHNMAKSADALLETVFSRFSRLDRTL